MGLFWDSYEDRQRKFEICCEKGHNLSRDNGTTCKRCGNHYCEYEDVKFSFWVINPPKRHRCIGCGGEYDEDPT